MHPSNTMPNRYLETLMPYANNRSTKFSAPESMLEELSAIAKSKQTTRLDLMRLICAEFIERENE